MIELSAATKIQRILCLGAHSDDIEIGCGGTILKWTAQRPDLEIRWVVFSAHDAREAEARRAAGLFLAKAARADVRIHHFRDGFMPFVADQVKEQFETLKDFAPDVVFTHYRDDLHQDHGLLSRLTWNTFRDHLILEYEIPKYDGDLGRPNAFVRLDDATRQAKIDHLMSSFITQAGKSWFTPDTFDALLRLRGVECQTRFAEAFHCRKILL
jgi:LmbE family N-acetylglucosaminyl deacetylase